MRYKDPHDLMLEKAVLELMDLDFTAEAIPYTAAESVVDQMVASGEIGYDEVEAWFGEIEARARRLL